MIFVGGLRGTAKEKDLNNFFSQFGEVKEVKIKRKKTATGFLVCIGHCIITMSSIEGQAKVLAQNDLYFEGRKLYCQRYMTGPELSQFHKNFNSRRVHICGLFEWITDDQFLKTFAKFGPIENGYILKETSQNASKGSGFILYRDPQSAIQAISAYVSFGGMKFLKVQYFNKKVCKIKFEENECRTLSDIIKDQEKRILSNLIQRLCGKSFEYQKNNIDQNSLIPGVLNIPSADYNLLTPEIIKFFDSEILENLENIFRQNCPIYYEVYQKVEKYIQNFLYIEHHFDVPIKIKNYRENLYREKINKIIQFFKNIIDINFLREFWKMIKNKLKTNKETRKLWQIKPTSRKYHKKKFIKNCFEINRVLRFNYIKKSTKNLMKQNNNLLLKKLSLHKILINDLSFTEIDFS